MNDFFKEFSVEKGSFNIKNYFPDVPFSFNPFKKTAPIPVPDFTIGMLIESAKAGRWLYD
ncbi:Acyl carrier protein [Yersinia aldovae ATCC 35236]|nr:Acyl carrier protein [Yersinia aldovae ATCC 35236]